MNRITTYDREYAEAWACSGIYIVSGETVIGTPCVYCGEYASEREHVIPYSWMQNQKRTMGIVENFWTWIVPSCGECNRTAQAMLFGTVKQKRRYLQERIKAKYSESFVHEAWSDEEIEELGPSLRQYVGAIQAREETARLRASYDGPIPPTAGSAAAVRAVSEALERRKIKDAA